MGHRTVRRRGDINVQADELRRRIEMLERRQPPELFVVLERLLFAPPNALDGNLPPEATDTSVGPGKAVFSIDPELDDWYVIQGHAFVATTGDETVVEVENLTQSTIIIPEIVIPAGEYTSSCVFEEFAAIDYDNDQVDGCDMISLNVLSGSTTQGLGVYVHLSGTPGDELVTP